MFKKVLFSLILILLIINFNVNAQKISFDFETRMTSDWSAHNCEIKRSSLSVRSGNYSCFVFNRINGESSFVFNTSVGKSGNYTFSVFINPVQSATFKLKLACDSAIITSAPIFINAEKFTQCVLNAEINDCKNAVFTVESDIACDFYIDGLSLLTPDNETPDNLATLPAPTITASPIPTVSVKTANCKQTPLTTITTAVSTHASPSPTVCTPSAVILSPETVAGRTLAPEYLNPDKNNDLKLNVYGTCVCVILSIAISAVILLKKRKEKK